MSGAAMIGSSDGEPFEDGADHGRVLVSGTDTGGAYSLMEWTVVSCLPMSETTPLDFGPHHHAEIEEIFVIRRGTLDFLLGDVVTTLRPNDVVRVPAGTRHGYLNHSGRDVEMLVMFCPGGFEALFVKYRTDQPHARGDGFVADARRLFATEFET